MPPELMSDAVTFVTHRPERRSRTTTLAAAACCCCCCCCVHSLGGIAGAIYGGRGGHRPVSKEISKEDAAKEVLETGAADKYAVRVYWLALLIVVFIAFLVGLVGGRHDEFWIGPLLIAMCLPAGQLGASVLALIYINVFPPARKTDSLRRLGRISLFAFIWGLIGFALMVPFAYMIK
jgi:streptolysin S family bacteriocin protoxin